MRSFLIIVLVLSAAPIRAEFIRFEAIESLPGGDGTSWAYAMSRNGSVVLGDRRSDRGNEAFVWTRQTGTIGLGFLAANHDQSTANGATGDGHTVVGNSSRFADGRFEIDGFIWTPTTGMTALPDRPENAVERRIAGISADGRVVGGDVTLTTEDGGTIRRAFRWTAEGGTEILEAPEGYDARVDGISADGRTLVGLVQDDAFNSTPARWTESDGLSLLETPEGYLNRGVAWGSNSDGTVIFGIAGIDPVFQFQGFRWTEETGMVGLGLYPGAFAGFAYDVTEDGSTIVGSYVFRDDDGVSNTRAMIWDEASGQRNLQEFITTRYGFDFGGWTFERANALSGDGRTIVGTGLDPDGIRRGFVLTIVPEPSTVVMLGIGLVSLVGVHLRKLRKRADWARG